MKAAIYGRISTDKQSELSIEAQFERCESYCESNNWPIYDYYADVGISGTKASTRPELMRLLADATAGRIQVVVAHKVDRAFRNMRDYENIKYELEKVGVVMAFAESGMNDGLQGDFINGLMALMAQQYSANLSRETKKTIRANVKRGHFMGGTPPLGYKIIDKKFTIDPETSKAVEMIFDLYANKNYSLREIAETLNNKGYRTMIGREFKHTSIHTILENEKYIGIYEHGDVKVEDVIPPLVDMETWHKVRKKMKSNKRLGRSKSINKRFYLLSGLIRCGECKNAYVGQPHRNSRGYETVYYRCNHCGNKPIKREWIEEKAIDSVAEMCSNIDIEQATRDANARIEAYNAEAKQKFDVLNSELKKLRIKEDNIVDAIAETGINPKLKKSLFEIQDKISEVQENITEAPDFEELRPFDIDLMRDALSLTLFQIRNGSNEEKREAIQAVIHSVTIYPEQVLIKIKANLSASLEIPSEVVGMLVAEAPSQHLSTIIIPFVYARE